MQFNDVSGLDGLVQDYEERLGLPNGYVSGNTIRLKQFTRKVNAAYGRVAIKILKVDGRMQWDDPNHGDQPKSNFGLVSGQEDYEIFTTAPAATKDWLEVERVEILDSNGNGILLAPFDHKEINVAMSEYLKTASIPEFFDFNGTQLLLYPKPNYSLNAGGTVFFNREPNHFAYNDTTKRPGFATPFHKLLSLWPGYEDAPNLGKGSLVSAFAEEISITEKDLSAFYAGRAKYEKKRVTRFKQSFK